MVRLRLQRHGAKKRPFYRLVAADKRAARDGRFIENLGTFDPLQEPPVLRLNKERIDYWLSVGASPSETAAALIKKLNAGEGIDLSAEGAEAAAKKARAEARESAKTAAREEAKKAAAEAAKAKAEEEKKAAAEAKAAEEAAAAEEAKAEEAKGDDGAEAASEDGAAEEASSEEE